MNLSQRAQPAMLATKAHSLFTVYGRNTQHCDAEKQLLVNFASQPIPDDGARSSDDRNWPIGRARQRLLPGTPVHKIWFWLSDSFGESYLTGMGNEHALAK